MMIACNWNHCSVLKGAEGATITGNSYTLEPLLSVHILGFKQKHNTSSPP